MSRDSDVTLCWGFLTTWEYGCFLQINWLIRRGTADGIFNVWFANNVCPIQITLYDYAWSSAVLYSYDLTKYIICYLSTFVYYRRRLSSFSLLTTRGIRMCCTFFFLKTEISKYNRLTKRLVLYSVVDLNKHISYDLAWSWHNCQLIITN